MTQPHHEQSKSLRSSAPDPGVRKTLRVLDRIFGPPDERRFDIRLWDGSVYPSRTSSRADFSLVVARRGGLRRMLLPPSELATAEAFIRGDIDIEGNLGGAMSLGDQVGSRIQSFGRVASLLPLVLALPADDEADPAELRHRSRSLKLLNPHARQGGGEEIQFHYDVGNDFYSLWLDPRMMYTCAYFRSAGDDLETAQLAKLDHICRKLRLAPGQRLLDIGCGWGGLMMHAAKNYGVRAVGITLSEAQGELARTRIAAEGLSDMCEVRLQDYRDLLPGESFDKIVSVGMMEHVAEKLQPEYFSIAFRALKPGGLFLNHFIASNVTARNTNGLAREVRRVGFGAAMSSSTNMFFPTVARPTRQSNPLRRSGRLRDARRREPPRALRDDAARVASWAREEKSGGRQNGRREDVSCLAVVHDRRRHWICEWVAQHRSMPALENGSGRASPECRSLATTSIGQPPSLTGGS